MKMQKIWIINLLYKEGFKNITLNEGYGYMLNKSDTLDHIVDGFAFYNVSLVLHYNSPFSSKKSE